MKTRALLLALPLLALGPAGCVSNGASIQIQGICGPTTGCNFTGQCGALIVVNPTLDSSLTTVMTLFFQLENQLPDNSNLDIKKLNTNDATVEEAVLEYSGALSGKVTLGVNGVVPAPGTTVLGVDVIPGSVGAALPVAPPTYPDFLEVVVRMRLRGHYGDGSSFETAEFPMSIDITSSAPQTATCPGACPQVGQYPAGCP